MSSISSKPSGGGLRLRDVRTGGMVDSGRGEDHEISRNMKSVITRWTRKLGALNSIVFDIDS